MKIKNKLKNDDFFAGWMTGIACYLGAKIIVCVIAIIVALALKAV